MLPAEAGTVTVWSRSSNSCLLYTSSALVDEGLRAHPVSPLYYGDARDHCYGAGLVYASEPPSYQIIIYDTAGDSPAWMREATICLLYTSRCV